MGLLDKFKKKEKEPSPKIEDLSDEELKRFKKKTTMKLYETIKDEIKTKTLEDIENASMQWPTHFILKDVKSPEEYQLREEALQCSMIEEYDKCVEYCNQGLEINPNSPYLLYLRGRTFSDMGQLENGFNDLTRAVKLRKDFADAHYEIGRIHHMTNNMDAGILAYGTAQELEPGYYHVFEKGEDGKEDPRGSLPTYTQTLTENGVKIVLEQILKAPKEIELVLTGFFAICGEKKLFPEFLNPPPYNIQLLGYSESTNQMKEWCTKLAQLLVENGLDAQVKENEDSLEIQTFDTRLEEWVPAVVIRPNQND